MIQPLTVISANEYTSGPPRTSEIVSRSTSRAINWRCNTYGISWMQHEYSCPDGRFTICSTYGDGNHTAVGDTFWIAELRVKAWCASTMISGLGNVFSSVEILRCFSNSPAVRRGLRMLHSPFADQNITKDLKHQVTPEDNLVSSDPKQLQRGTVVWCKLLCHR